MSEPVDQVGVMDCSRRKSNLAISMTGGPVPKPVRDRTAATWDVCLHFMTNPRVPFTNNQAEQALRMVERWMKISDSFRTRAGGAHFAQLRGLLETARKQGRDLLAVLQPDPFPT